MKYKVHIDIPKSLINWNKILRDAENMTKQEFIQKYGEHYLKYYDQVQSMGGIEASTMYEYEQEGFLDI